MSDSRGSTQSNATNDENRLERAREAAREFCVRFEFPNRYLNELDGDVIQEPMVIDRDGVSVEVFSWLGRGRGAPYVQAEVNNETGDVTVYGGFDHREFGPWKKS